jgi:ABC-type nitrate/sulfonate/bicarbonate transport system substrate-binding protein
VTRRSFLQAFGLGLIAVACTPATTPPPPTAAPTAAPAATEPAASVKIVYTQPAAGFMGLWIAADQGLFKKYGLADIDVARVAPPADIQGLVTGEFHFSVDGSAGVAAVARGADLTYIGSPLPYYAQALYADPSIERVADLVGKSVGATTQGGSSDNALRTLLAREGVDPATVNIVYLRDDAGILAAVQSRVVAAALMTSPNTLRAGQAGYKELQNLVPLHLRTITQGLLVKKSWAQANEPTVLGFLQAFMEAVRIARTHPEVAKPIISKYTQLEDPAQLDDSYKNATSSMVVYPIMTDASVQNVLDLSVEPEIKAHKPSDFYDNSYLQKLEPFAKTLFPDGVIPAE